MNRFVWKLIAALITPLALNAFGQEKTMFINRDNTKLLSEKNTKSPSLTTLKEGDIVIVEEGGNALFRKIRTSDGKMGFVPYVALAEKHDRSMRKVVNFVRSFTRPAAEDNDTARSRSANAVMGIRGLASTSDEALAKVNAARPNLAAVYQMEDQNISQEHVQRLSELVLGEIERNLAP